MNRKIVLVISLLAAALCLAACSNKEKPKHNGSGTDKETSAAKDDESAAEDEEDTLGVLKDMYEDRPSVIKGLILESKSTWRNSPDIEEMAEEGFTKKVAISDFELDEVFEMYIDTDLDDGWHIYICRQENIGDMSTLTEDKLKELSDKDGYANTLGNKPNRENHGDIGGMCVASDESTEGRYVMFFVRGGEIDSFIELDIKTPSDAE